MDRRDSGKDGRMRLGKPIEIRSVSEMLARGVQSVASVSESSVAGLRWFSGVLVLRAHEGSAEQSQVKEVGQMDRHSCA